MLTQIEGDDDDEDIEDGVGARAPPPRQRRRKYQLRARQDGTMMPVEMQDDKDTRAIDGGFFEDYIADYEKVGEGASFNWSCTGTKIIREGGIRNQMVLVS